MPTDRDSIRCPNCGTVFAVEGEWRVVLCPNCQTPVTRMSGDSEYD